MGKFSYWYLGPRRYDICDIRFVNYKAFLNFFFSPILSQIGEFLFVGFELNFQFSCFIEGSHFNVTVNRVKSLDILFNLLDIFREQRAVYSLSRRRFVNEVYRFVRQKSVVDIPIAHYRRGIDSAVFDSYAVMFLIFAFQSMQYRYRIADRRRIYRYGLESSFKRAVFFKIFSVLVQRRRADGLQFPSRKLRFEYVCRVHAALGATRSDDSMNLVDKEYCIPSFVESFDCLFKTLFKFASVFRTGKKTCHIQGKYAFVFEKFGNFSLDYCLGKSLDDRAFTDARFAYKDRVIFLSSRKYLYYSVYLAVSSNYRVEFSVPRFLSKVFAQSRQSVAVVFLVLFDMVGHTFHIRSLFFKVASC